jgi:hypothetical protein
MTTKKLTRQDADALWEAAVEAEAEVAKRYPTEQDCFNALADAGARLKQLGWNDSMYAPADGKLKPVFSPGSRYSHESYCIRKENSYEKWWWHPAEGDLWPDSPIYYKEPG